MNDTAVDQHDQHTTDQPRFDLAGVAAPILALLSLVFTVVTSDLSAKYTHIGLTLMLVCMAGHVYHFRGKPRAERPPVVVTPTAMMLIGGFCAGTVICGLGMSGPFGLAMQYLPSIFVILISAWFHTPAGKAKRAQMAEHA